MHRGHRRLVLVLAAAVALAAVSSTAPARAYHDDGEQLTDGTAYTLHARDLRLGPFKVQYGVFDALTVGTYVAPWVIRMPNLHVKWRYLHQGPWTAAVQVGSYRLDVSELKLLNDHPGDAVITAGTFEPSLSVRSSEDFTLSVSLPYTVVRAEGSLDTEAFEGALSAAVDNFQATLALEYRISRTTALLLRSRYLVFQLARADGRVVLRPDDYTTIDVSAAATSSALDFKGAWSAVAGVAFSFDSFNLELGAGYGNWNVAPFNFVLPGKMVIPELELYWVF